MLKVIKGVNFIDFSSATFWAWNVLLTQISYATGTRRLFIYFFFLHFLIPEVCCFRFLCSYTYVFLFFSLFFLSFFFFGHFSDTFRLPLFSPCQPVYREYPLLPAWPEGSDYGFASLILLLHLVSVLLNFNGLSRCKQDNTLDLCWVPISSVINFKKRKWATLI